MIKILKTILLTIAFTWMWLVRHRSFDGWWRYRFEVSMVWDPRPTIRFVEEGDEP